MTEKDELMWNLEADAQLLGTCVTIHHLAEEAVAKAKAHEVRASASREAARKRFQNGCDALREREIRNAQDMMLANQETLDV